MYDEVIVELRPLKAVIMEPAASFEGRLGRICVREGNEVIAYGNVLKIIKVY